MGAADPNYTSPRVAEVALRREDPETGLTGPEEMFCVLYLKNPNATAAYRIAFPRSLKWKESSQNERASALLSSIKVQSRLSQLRSDLRIDARISLADHLEELKTLREMAKEDRAHAAAITAETNRGKVSGLYVEKVDATLSNPDGSPLFSRIERVIIGKDKR